MTNDEYGMDEHRAYSAGPAGDRNRGKSMVCVRRKAHPPLAGLGPSQPAAPGFAARPASPYRRFQPAATRGRQPIMILLKEAGLAGPHDSLLAWLSGILLVASPVA